MHCEDKVLTPPLNQVIPLFVFQDWNFLKLIKTSGRFLFMHGRRPLTPAFASRRQTYMSDMTSHPKTAPPPSSTPLYPHLTLVYFYRSRRLLVLRDVEPWDMLLLSR